LCEPGHKLFAGAIFVTGVYGNTSGFRKPFKNSTSLGSGELDLLVDAVVAFS
jgi:hypothetical protein